MPAKTGLRRSLNRPRSFLLTQGRELGAPRGDYDTAAPQQTHRLLDESNYYFVKITNEDLDAAWFRWIVRYHHRAASVAAWAGFRDGASLDDSSPPTRSLLDRLPSLRILELIDPLPADSPARARWLDQLRASLRPE